MEPGFELDCMTSNSTLLRTVSATRLINTVMVYEWSCEGGVVVEVMGGYQSLVFTWEHRSTVQ